MDTNTIAELANCVLEELRFRYQPGVTVFYAQRYEALVMDVLGEQGYDSESRAIELVCQKLEGLVI